MNIKLSNLFFILAISVCPISYSTASPDSSVQLMYAEKLFEDSLYEASILEFKRYIFYNPESKLIDYAYYKIGRTYYSIKQYTNARQAFNKIIVDFPESSLKFDAKMMLAKIHFQEDNYSAARREIWQFLNMESDDEKLRLVARYMQSWCYLYERNWYSAITEFRKINKLAPDSELGQQSEKVADTVLSGTRIPRKSPSLARWMSRFIPGSGQIYAGRILNGLTSMFLNGAFFYLLADAISDERYVDAVGIYLVGSRFYFGNVYNAEKFVNDYNHKLDEQIIESAMDLSRLSEKINW